MIQITHCIAIDEKEIDESFVCSSGPGGQNVNKLRTARSTMMPLLPPHRS